MAENQEYGGDEIKILEGLDPVRKRPGMYIGSTSASGLHHLVWEIVDNAVDEALAGFCTQILVTVHQDNSVTVVDNGRGIPVDLHPVKKIPTLEVVLTILHAGGKFDNAAYKVSGGLHGVGSSVVNALSKKMIAQVRRDGKVYEMQFARGKTTQKMKVVGTSDTTGTTITFWPDDEIFETTVYDYDTLHDRLQEMAFLNRGLKIVLTDERERTPRVEEFCYQGGIIDFVKFLNEGEDVPEGLKEPIYLRGENTTDDPAKRAEVEVAIQWNTSYSENVMSFANNIYTMDGGTHLEGFRQAHEHSRCKIDETLLFLELETDDLRIDAIQQAVARKADCLLCMDDHVAMLALNTVRQMGLKVPNDIRIASLYDGEALLDCTPQITAVSFDPELLGKRAAQQLLAVTRRQPVETGALLGYQVGLRTSTQT